MTLERGKSKDTHELAFVGMTKKLQSEIRRMDHEVACVGVYVRAYVYVCMCVCITTLEIIPLDLAGSCIYIYMYT